MAFQNFFPIFTNFIMYLQWNKIVFDMVVFLQILCCPLKFPAYLTFSVQLQYQEINSND